MKINYKKAIRVKPAKYISKIIKILSAMQGDKFRGARFLRALPPFIFP